MDTREEIRRIVNNNRLRFMETIPTLLFIEGFPGLHHFKRERLKCRLSNEGEFEANSDLINAMLKVDNFPEQFVAFCDNHECCAELKELILPVLMQSHRYYSAQQNRTPNNSRNGISAAAAITQPSDETYSEVTVITQQSCVTHAEAGEMDSGNTQNGHSVPSETSNGEVDGTGRDSQIEGAENNSLSNKDEVCRATAMINNMDSNLSPHKASAGVKAIFGGSTNTDAQATEERHIGEFEGASDSDDSSSFYISSIEYEPVNEIENVKENLPAQSSVREEYQLLLLSSHTSESDQSNLLKNAGACSKNMVSQDRSIASHSKAGIADINTKSLVTGLQVIGAQERVNNYSGVQCQEDILKIKLMHDPANNTHLSNSLEEALQNSCPLSALSETEALNSETELKQFMTESSSGENFEGETLKENLNSTFNQFPQLVIPDPQINVNYAPNIPFDQLQLVIPDPQISVDSAPNSTFGLDPQISEDSAQSRLTIQENKNNSADDSEVDVFNNQTIPPNATPSQNDSSNSASVRVFHALSNFALFFVRQVLDSF